MKGAKNAKVVIQEFSEFQCPYCKRANETVKQVVKNYGDKVKIVWRNVPLSFHKQAMPAAEAAMEAYDQKGDDGFWKYHDKLWESQSKPGGLERDNLEKIAQELGLNMTEFKEALDKREHKARIEADAAVANKAGIKGTPGFVIKVPAWERRWTTCPTWGWRRCRTTSRPWRPLPWSAWQPSPTCASMGHQPMSGGAWSPST